LNLGLTRILLWATSNQDVEEHHRQPISENPRFLSAWEYRALREFVRHHLKSGRTTQMLEIEFLIFMIVDCISMYESLNWDGKSRNYMFWPFTPCFQPFLQEEIFRSADGDFLKYINLPDWTIESSSCSDV
jgi:hypothetical protein